MFDTNTGVHSSSKGWLNKKEGYIYKQKNREIRKCISLEEMICTVTQSGPVCGLMSGLDSSSRDPEKPALKQ